jgi:hypothetical protein
MRGGVLAAPGAIEGNFLVALVTYKQAIAADQNRSAYTVTASFIRMESK